MNRSALGWGVFEDLRFPAAAAGCPDWSPSIGPISRAFIDGVSLSMVEWTAAWGPGAAGPGPA